MGKEQQGKIAQLERKLAEEVTMHEESKVAKKKLERLEKLWVGVRRIMDETTDDVTPKVEVKSEV
jgi:hypothetical protein